MTPILIFFSFMLHILAFIIIFILYKKINAQENQTPEEVMDVLDSFLQDIKEENTHLLAQINRNSTTEQKVEEALPDEGIAHAILEKKDDALHLKAPQSNVEDTYEQSLQSRILHLYGQGHTIEEIAKQLDCGKTEAELIIKMYSK
ncbi:DUF6115 domain-containing protein [Lentibacillus saliphilus]|uniref:DUF6115 domain-containing protein n=1 Tax=Lentibacillus saliphilus TaxID=2737028 RepID=UPI001C2FB638|nr:hypothetical protein [Lentibacillus saliphilus]